MKAALLEKQIAKGSGLYVKKPYVQMAGEILTEMAHKSTQVAELIEQKLAVPELSLENCADVLLEYAKSNPDADCWTYDGVAQNPENPAIKMVMDFYEIPSAWVFKTGKAPARTVDMVTAEIQLIQAQVKKVFYDAVIQIGTRLLEVKELVPHGEWTSYLETRLGYKPSTAQNYMRIAKEFGDGQVSLDGTDPQSLFGELGYAQLLPLLSLPDEERRTLAQENNLESMSSREIEELVKARKAAEEKTAQVESELTQAKAAEKAALDKAIQVQAKLEKAEKSQKAAKEREANALAAQRTAEQRADKLAEEHKFLQNQLHTLNERAQNEPIQAEVVPSEAELEQVREEVRKEMQTALHAAEDRAQQAEARLEKAKNPSAMRVNLIFEEMQAQVDKLETALAALAAEQPEVGEKFRAAICQYFASHTQR